MRTWHARELAYGFFTALSSSFGQGAMSLLSATAMARYFSRRRGFALGVASLGYPCGEMLLPAVTLAAIGVIGWRPTLLVYLVLLAAGVASVALFLLARPLRYESAQEAEQRFAGSRTTRIKFPWWRDPLFLLVTGTTSVLPFGGTILLLYLLPIVKSKGWPTDAVAAGFVVFALTRSATSLLVGPLIDRFGGMRLFAFGSLCRRVGHNPRSAVRNDTFLAWNPLSVCSGTGLPDSRFCQICHPVCAGINPLSFRVTLRNRLGRMSPFPKKSCAKSTRFAGESHGGS